jgi:hypothetical protein
MMDRQHQVAGGAGQGCAAPSNDHGVIWVCVPVRAGWSMTVDVDTNGRIYSHEATVIDILSGRVRPPEIFEVHTDGGNRPPTPLTHTHQLSSEHLCGQ